MKTSLSGLRDNIALDEVEKEKTEDFTSRAA